MKVLKISFLRIGLAFLFCASLFSLNAQQGVIWTRIPNFEKLNIQNLDKQLVSTSPELNQLIRTFKVENIFQALPASKNPVLQEIYEINCECNEHELLQVLSKLNTIFIEPEIGPHYETLYTPNDYNIAFPYDYALEMIGAKEAWDITKGDTSVLISISDAGFDFNHVEFQEKIASISSNLSYSNIAHGTAVALTAAGATDNGFGKSAIGYKSSLDLRGMNYNELLASTYAGADIVNASWAAGCYYSQWGQMVIDEIHGNGTVIVAAAGNGSTCNNPSTPVYPASYNHVISVTSVGPSNNHERTIGDPTSTHQHNSMVDIAAPGYDLPVAITNNGFTTANGTSFAAPLVSGTVALMLAVNPCLNPDEIELILKQSADTIINTLNPQYAGLMGAGRLNAAKAVEMAMKYSTFQASTTIETYCQFNSQVIYLTELNGASPYEINWSHGDPGLFCVTGPADTYSVIITDSLGCRFYEEFEIGNIVPFQVEASIQPISCYGANDAMIALNISGGYPEYTVNWSNMASTTTIENLSPGIYEVQITDSKGCSYTDFFEITEPDPLIVTLDITNPSEFSNGSIDVTATGGTGNLTYSWHTGATTEDLFDLSPGVYQITVTDMNGCSNSKMAYLQNITVAGLTETILIEVQLYPNPTTDLFQINSSNQTISQFKIINGLGQLVDSRMVNSQTVEISAKQWESGTYHLEITLNDGQTLIKKILVNH